MDQTDAGGDSTEQFHRNEAISAVVDEGFLGEDDDDYEDLYNDVNVGEGFLQSVKKNEQVEEPVEPVIHPVVDDRKFECKNEVFSEPRVELGVKHEMVGSKDDVFGEPRVEIGKSVVKLEKTESRNEVNNNSSMPNLGMGQQQTHMGSLGNAGSGNVNGSGGNAYGNGGGGGMNVGGGVGGGGVNMGGGGGGTILFVGDLNWWTTDAELESELCKYGNVKEVKFFDEKASGKSKGYCQVEFYDPSAAAACKEGMNGHVFNGRPCVVAFASPFSVKRMGEAQVNRNQQMAQSNAAQAKRGPGDVPGKTGGNNMPAGGNFQGGGDNNNRGYGRGNWGRGNAQGMAGRGPGRGGRGMMNGGNGFGPPPMMHPQSMMGQGFDPSFGGPMGRMGGYGGFPGAPTPPFSGMMPSFPPALPGLAPHVNPAFFGRGMPMNGMGMMPASGVDGNMGMWSDPNMPGWAGDEQGGRVGESSYGEEAASDQQFGEGSHDRGDWPNPAKEKDRRHRDDRDREVGYEKDVREEEWPERRHRDERDRERSRDRDHERSRDRDRDRDRERSRDRERGRDRHRDERDRYADHHRYREVEPEYDDEWERGRSSRGHGKSRLAQEDEHRSRSRDADYGKKRRVTAE
ncbi:putative RNA recognition motif domain, nucleotide-binding alpha-beta plait domain superfamily [Helianthus anomalus]